MRLKILCPACAHDDCDQYGCANPDSCGCEKHGSEMDKLKRQVEGLQRELTEFKERFERFLETNNFWDGS